MIILGIVAIIFSLTCLLALGALLGNRVPWTEPPGIRARLGIYLTTNVAEISADAMRPELTVPHFAEDPKLVFACARRTLGDLGWGEAGADPKLLTIHAVVVSSLLRFKDDVEIRFDAGLGGGTRIEIRAAARIGRGDFGANTRHVMDFLDGLASRLQRDAENC